ncbi:MAG TPA: hypothetical protein VKE69_05855 [Planctomycetota bacterium]|nr:hypothetical protein [Planctomycetota bacterium]
MRALTSRERWGIAGLVPVLAVAAYVVFLREPIERRISAAAAQLDSSPPPTKAELEQADKAVAAAQNDLDEALRATEDVNRRVTELRREWARPNRRAKAIQELTERFSDLGILVEASSQAAARSAHSKDGAPPVPASLRSLEQAVAELGGSPPELWRLDLRGSYEAFAGALERAPRLRSFVLPIAVAIEPSAGPDVLTATLWIWI